MQGSALAQDALEKVFKPWCKQRAPQLFRFAHKRFSDGEGRGGVVFEFGRTSDVAGGSWPTDEVGWKYLSQDFISALGIKTNHVLSAVQRYSPDQQCVVIALVKEAKFDRFYFLNAPRYGSRQQLDTVPCNRDSWMTDNWGAARQQPFNDNVGEVLAL
jgi:hypothetical protein